MFESAKNLSIILLLIGMTNLAEAGTISITEIRPSYEISLPGFNSMGGTRLLQEATVVVELSGLTFFATQTPGVPHTHDINVEAGPIIISGITSVENLPLHRHGWSASGSYVFTGAELDLFRTGSTFFPITPEFSSRSSFPGHAHSHKLPGSGFQSKSTTTFVFTTVPEPTFMVLTGIASGVFLARKRNRMVFFNGVS